MNFLSLFSGIGGLDLGLERAGMRCVGQVEIDPFCRAVLAKHWPGVPRMEDVREVKGDEFGPIDCIAGGFPCQDISSCNYRATGLSGAKSGLWFEFLRLIRVCRPGWVIAENVTALTFRGLDRVLCDLASCGLDAEWQTVTASSLGAPHTRERVFIVAYRASERLDAPEVFNVHAREATRQKQASRLRWWPGRRQSGNAHAPWVRWCPHSELCRMADGVPDRMDRYTGLGNAVVPQVAEVIGRAILAAHAECAA